MKILWKSNAKYKYKLLISYFLIVSTPLIIMTGILYNISATNMRKEIEASNKYKLNQLKNNLDLRIKEMGDLASRLVVDNKLTPHNMAGNEYKRIEGFYQIGMYKAQNAFIDNYYLYMKNTGNVYSTAGQSTLSTHARNTYNLNAQNESGFINEINNLKFPAFIGHEWFEKNNAEPLDFITYMYPISYGSYDPYGVVIFEIKKSTLAAMFKDITSDVKGSLIIFSDNNYVLLSENKAFELSLEDIKDISKINGINDKQSAPEKYKNKDISLIIDASEITRLTFVLAIPKAQIVEQLVNIRTLIAEAFLIILAFGTLLAIVFSINVYKPINKLTNTISRQWLELNEHDQSFKIPAYNHEQQNNKNIKNKEQWYKRERQNNLDELAQIGQTVEIALEQNKNLKAQINMQRPFIRDQILTKILKGETLNESTMNGLFKFSNVKFEGSSYAVVMIDKLIKSEERFIRKFKEKVLSITEGQFGLKNVVYPVELIQDNAIALILNINIEEDEYELYIQFISNIKQVLEDITKEQIILGGGKLYNSVNKINRSFIEALAALEENRIRGKQDILLFDEIANSQEQVLWYPAEEQLKFIHSLKQGDKVVALESLENMFKSIEKNQSSILILKYIYYDIVNMIIKSINEMKISNLDYNIENLLKFSNIEELEKETKVIVQKLCEVIKENKSSKSAELNNRILVYIDSNFNNANLSLESVADEFGFSIYYLSRFFKEHTTHTFTDYVINLRIKKAKELLSTTDLPIKEIVSNIGYTDLTYFMKRFKKIEGITPGQYRELYKVIKT